MKHKNKLILYIILWIIAWIFALIFLPIENAKAEAPDSTIKVEEMTIPETIAYYSIIYNTDARITTAVAKCESQFNPDTQGDYKDGKYLAQGLFQYHNETWYRHYKEFNKETGITLVKGVPQDDVQLGVWAIANGKGNEWSTYTSLKNGGTYSFYSKLLGRHYTVKCIL